MARTTGGGASADPRTVKLPREPRPKTERVAAKLQATAPERWLANIRMSGFTIMMFVLLVIGVVILAPSLKLLIEQKTQIAGLQKAVADQKHHTAELRSQVARWDDPAYIEAQARNRLLFVFPGETSYLVVNDLPAATAATGGPISTKIQTTKVDWVSSLTSSLLTAGLTTSPAPVSDTPIQSPVTGNG